MGGLVIARSINPRPHYHTRELQSEGWYCSRVDTKGETKISCYNLLMTYSIILKSLDPLRAKKTFIRKKLGHTAVSAIKASSVTL